MNKNEKIINLLRVVVLFVMTCFLSSCGSKMVTESTVPRPSVGPASDMARIVFMLPQNLMGPSDMPIVEGKDVLGCLAEKSYTIVEVPTGEHQIVLFIGWFTQALMGNFEGGKTYYIKVKIRYGLHLTQVDPGDKLVTKWLVKKGDRVEMKSGELFRWYNQNRIKIIEKVNQYKNNEGTPLVINPELAQ